MDEERKHCLCLLIPKVDPPFWDEEIGPLKLFFPDPHLGEEVRPSKLFYFGPASKDVDQIRYPCREELDAIRLCALENRDMEFYLQWGIVPLDRVTDEAYKKFSLVAVPSLVMETTEGPIEVICNGASSNSYREFEGEQKPQLTWLKKTFPNCLAFVEYPPDRTAWP
jgi:hypothetical protein